MAPYDSDSSDDDEETQLSYTETDVLLGYADEEPGSETISRLGGHPDWLVTDQPPSAALARCRVCKDLMVLLLQLNAELPDRFAGHERRLYVLACRNKTCRRKVGSTRAIRGVRVDKQAEMKAASGKKAAAEAAKETKKATEPPKPTGTAPGLGEALFGVKNPFAVGGSSAGASSNPFATPSSSASGPAKNPFSVGGGALAAGAAANPFAPKNKEPEPEPTPAAASPASASADPAKDLSKTFAETLALNSDNNGSKGTAHGPPPPPEPWPAEDTWPTAYPVNWIADAEYETLDPTPATPLPRVQTDGMDLDEPSSSSGGGGKEDKYIFESSMDAAFQKFADRISQNPDQVIRYEFAGQPLLYSRDDAIAQLWPHTHQQQHTGVSTAVVGSALPRCPQCGARRVFEVQLMPHAIDLLEASELGLEGMDWGTVLVGVCERDCQTPGTAPGEASYVEEWVGVQWEELQTKR